MPERDPRFHLVGAAWVTDMFGGSVTGVGVSAASLTTYAAGISKMFREHLPPLPSPMDEPLCTSVLAGARQESGHIPSRVEPILLPTMHQIVQLYVADDDAIAARNTFFLIAQFMTWARAASAVPRSVGGFKAAEHLQIQDVKDFKVGGQRWVAIGLKSQKGDPKRLRLDATGHDWVPCACSPGRLLDIGTAWDQMRLLFSLNASPPHHPLIQQATPAGLSPQHLPATACHLSAHDRCTAQCTQQTAPRLRQQVWVAQPAQGGRHRGHQGRHDARADQSPR